MFVKKYCSSETLDNLSNDKNQLLCLHQIEK